MDAATVTSIGTSAGLVLAAIVAAFENARAKRAEAKAGEATKEADEAKKQSQSLTTGDLAKANQDMAEAYRARAEEWRNLYDTQHKELMDYRAYVHNKAKDDQATLLKLTEENADLRARTDLTPLIEHMGQQSETNRQVATSLSDLASAVKLLLDRVKPEQTT